MTPRPRGAPRRPRRLERARARRPPVVDLAVWAAWRWAGPVVVVPRDGVAGAGGPARCRPGDRDRRRRPGVARAAARWRWWTPPSAAGGTAVVRLAPALDASLLVLELVHRRGAGRGAGAGRRPAPGPSTWRTGCGRAGVPVALLPDGWAAARRGGRVVVGTRAAAWAPVPRLRAAVVLDAHDEAYREERAPTWSAVDVVLERGRRDGAPVLLVSPVPPAGR